MTLTPTEEGLEARLRPRGAGRFFSAAFLLIWLCGWLAGECFALWMLLGGAAALLSSDPPAPGRDPLPLAAALMGGLFLLFWLSLWTLGGWLAGREFLRLLWSEDRILVRPDALVIRRRIGPFRSTRTVPRDSLIGIHVLTRRRLIAETTGGSVELTNLDQGSGGEELAAALRQALGLGDESARRGQSLPRSWSEVIDDEGRTALVRDEGTRRLRGRFAWGLTVLVAGVAVPVVLAAMAADPLVSDGQLVPDARSGAGSLKAAGIMAALTAVLAWGAWWISRTRLEWRIDPGCLRLRRRSAGGVRELFEGRGLELIRSSDSDGDRWYTLNAVAAGAPPPAATFRFSDRRTRRTIVRAMDDPTEPQQVGAWLAARSGLRLDDPMPAEPATVTPAEVIALFESAGPLGRWIAKRLSGTRA